MFQIRYLHFFGSYFLFLSCINCLLSWQNLFNVNALTLSPLERLTLGSRLDSILRDVTKTITSKGMFDVDEPLEGSDLDVVIIFPGAGGPDQFTTELYENMLKVRRMESKHQNIVHVFDWSEHRGSIATAAYDSEAVGEAVARTLLSAKLKSNIRSIHGIGISVGGFAGNQFAKVCKEMRSDLYVRLSLLDPFCSRGLMGVGYGANEFGQPPIDYAEHYLNTDDPVPTTNEPLPCCAVFDVTGAKERNDFVLPENETMHCWPLVYYARFGPHSNVSDGCVELPTHNTVDFTGRGSITYK